MNRQSQYTFTFSSLIQVILSEIEEGIDGDLELIQNFITRKVYGELKARILETIELALGNHT